MNIKYSLPKLKENKETQGVEVSPYHNEFPDRYDRQIRVPLSKEQIAKLKVGGEATFTVKGKITELQNVENEKGRNRVTAELELSSIEIDAKNDMEKLLDEDE